MDSEELWRRVGLEELRVALSRIDRLTRDFEQALHKLPPCNDCARAALLERLSTSGRHLGHELVTLTVLAAALQQTVEVTQRLPAQLASNPPNPCQCPEGDCTCHP